MHAILHRTYSRCRLASVVLRRAGGKPGPARYFGRRHRRGRHVTTSSPGSGADAGTLLRRRGAPGLEYALPKLPVRGRSVLGRDPERRRISRRQKHWRERVCDVGRVLFFGSPGPSAPGERAGRLELACGGENVKYPPRSRLVRRYATSRRKRGSWARVARRPAGPRMIPFALRLFLYGSAAQISASTK